MASEKSNFFQLIERIKELNPDIDIRYDSASRKDRRIYSSVSLEELILPEGYYSFEGAIVNDVDNKDDEIKIFHSDIKNAPDDAVKIDLKKN